MKGDFIFMRFNTKQWNDRIKYLNKTRKLQYQIEFDIN